MSNLNKITFVTIAGLGVSLIIAAIIYMAFNDNSNNIDYSKINEKIASNQKEKEIKKKDIEENIQKKESVNIKKQLEQLYLPKSNLSGIVKEDFPNLPYIEMIPNTDLKISTSNNPVNQGYSYGAIAYLYESGTSSGTYKITHNDSQFKQGIGNRTTIGIEFNYQEDANASVRSSTPKDQLARLPEKYTQKREYLEQSVKFFVWDVKFNEKFNMPNTMIIWNEYSPKNYNCTLKENNFVHLGASYAVRYNCPELPRFNDYGGKLKFIFDYSK